MVWLTPGLYCNFLSGWYILYSIVMHFCFHWLGWVSLTFTAHVIVCITVKGKRKSTPHSQTTKRNDYQGLSRKNTQQSECFAAFAKKKKKKKKKKKNFEKKKKIIILKNIELYKKKKKKTKGDFFFFFCHFSILMFDMDFIKTVNLLNSSLVFVCLWNS